MKIVKWLVLGFSVLAVVLGLSAKLQAFGGQGIFTLAMSALPAVLIGLGLVLGKPFGRAFAGISLVSFGIVAMKTSEGLDNIMMAAAAGLVVALVLLIKPERAA